jgi:hypothetical protein
MAVVQVPMVMDQSLADFDQLRLARDVHQAELDLAAKLAVADRRLADARAEAKMAHRLDVNLAEAEHRKAISDIQLEQLKLRLVIEAGEDED